MSDRITDQQATDEAVLLFTRKLRRLEPAASARVWELLPREAQDALRRAEIRADKLRDIHGPIGTEISSADWPAKPEDDVES